MSIGPLGAIGSFAATPAAQTRGSDIEKNQTATADKSREQHGLEATERAAGIGEMHEDSQASDRDADGRKLWEAPPEKQAPEESSEEAVPQLSKDATGAAGGKLDLSG